MVLISAFRDHREKGDTKDVMDCFKNINQFWPETKEEIPDMIKEMLLNNKPSFISLRR